MAHEIDMTNGTPAFAFTGNRDDIWHRLGNWIDPARAIEVPYLREMGGLKHSVDKVPLNYEWNGQTMTAENLMGTVRSDNGFLLGSVSKSNYNTVQPEEVVAFFKDFLAENKLTISSLGALKHGRIIWALAEMGRDYDFILPGNDQIKTYIRLQTSYDKSRSTSLVATTIRQVCKNTEEMVETSTQGKQYITKHSQVFDAVALQKAIGLLGEQHRITAEAWNTLASAKISDTEAFNAFIDILNLPKNEEFNEVVVSTRSNNKAQMLMNLFKNGPGAGLKSADGTAYGVLNAVTHYVDHLASSRRTKGTVSLAESRMSSAWFGGGSVLKKRARDTLLKLVA